MNITFEKLTVYETNLCSDNEKTVSSTYDKDEGMNTNKIKITVIYSYKAYKFICTIPATSVLSERSFSNLKIVKIIKTRLRSTIGLTIGKFDASIV